MPLTYRIDDSLSLVTLTASGQITAADIAGYLAASRADPLYRADLRRLIVVDGVTDFPELPHIREITKRPQGRSPTPDVRIAAVATTPFGRGMIAMFLGHWGLSDRYSLFDDAAAARKWVLSEEAPND